MKHYLLFASQAYSIAILRPLEEAILSRGDDVCWYLHGLDRQLLQAEEKILTSVTEVKNYNPLAVFVPGNWVPDFFPGIKVEIFHGFGIEKKGHFDIRGFFDLYCTHGPATTIPFQKLKNKYNYFSVIETGWSKMDSLFKYNTAKPAENKTPTILYAPTFSPSLTSADDLFETIKSLSETQDIKWLIKFHPKMPYETQQRFRSIQNPNLEIIDDNDIIPLLHQADIMISDTSSVVAEFLCLNKPVITYKNRNPGPYIYNITTPDKLKNAIDYVIQHPEELAQHANNFIQQMHPYNDGQSSQRILDAVNQFISSDREKLKPKPWNLWRKFQVRHRLKYYHLK